MEAVSPLFAVAVIAIAVATAFVLGKRFGIPSSQGRFAAIDGLRGYLALFVFLHHSCIWFFYFKTGQWKVPPSNLYTHFGQNGVAFFFMITAFLFFSKLLDGKQKPIDWNRLFISRFFRIVPLYLFLMLLFALVIGYISEGILNEPLPLLINKACYWLGFTFFGNPNLNGLNNTFTIVAGVTWSLPYELFFYISLPMLALTVGLVPPLPYIALSIACMTWLLASWHPESYHLKAFLGGIVASLLVRSDSFCQIAASKVASMIAIASVTLVINLYPLAYTDVPLLLLSLAFAIFADGNSLFGVLTSGASRVLGEMAYSIYLLHGIFLFITFIFIIGIPSSQALLPMAHWSVIIGITSILIILNFLTFRWIERPMMQCTAVVNDWIRSRQVKPS